MRCRPGPVRPRRAGHGPRRAARRPADASPRPPCGPRSPGRHSRPRGWGWCARGRARRAQWLGASPRSLRGLRWPPGPPAAQGTDSGAVWTTESGTTPRGHRDRKAGPARKKPDAPPTAVYRSWPAAHCLPSGLSPSVQEFHLLNRPLAADGSRTVTAGSELHRPRSALLLLMSVQLQSATPGSRPCGRSAVGCLTAPPARRLSQRARVIRHSGKEPAPTLSRTDPRWRQFW